MNSANSITRPKAAARPVTLNEMQKMLAFWSELSATGRLAITAMAHALKDGRDPVAAMAVHIGRERAEQVHAIAMETVR